MSLQLFTFYNFPCGVKVFYFEELLYLQQSQGREDELRTPTTCVYT